MYLDGSGIEVGALHNPLAVPSQAKVRYVDRMPKEQLYEQYPELRALPLVDVDIVDDGERLTTLAPQSQDFIIANHFLEHCQDPIGTLKNFVRVLKVGGVVYAALPDMRFTFDDNRPPTTLDHIIRDHEEGPGQSRETHFDEWARYVDSHFGRHYPDEATIAARAKVLSDQDYSIHFHCWGPSGMLEFLQYVVSTMPLQLEIFVQLNKEAIFILRRIS